MRTIAQLLLTLVIAVVAWALLGYLATAPLGLVFGWSGHPAIPAAPWSVYVALYGVLLPLVCLLLGWRISRRLIASPQADRDTTLT